MPATTTLLGLVTPTQGTLSGTWGDTVNYGISDYVDISVAGTLTLTNDGAVTLANTTGSSAGSNITSTLTGAGTVTAQFAIVRVTGTLTVAKVVTGPSYSKTYTVVNAATGGIVTFKASGQTGVSVAVGESAFVYYNGTDYVKVSGTVAVASFQTSLGGLTPSTATTGVVTLAGTLNTTSGGTGLTSFTAGDVPYYASGSVLSKLAIGTAGQFLTSTGTAPQWSTLSGVAVTTFSAGTTGFTPNTATSGAITLAGTLATTNGGTGLTSFTSGGVVYASSTSVLATGSVLTFDGTNLGIGTNSPSAKLDITSASGGFSNIKLVQTGVRTWAIENTGTSGLFKIIEAGVSDRLVIDGSGLVGIGTSSPSYKLDVQTTATGTAAGDNTVAFFGSQASGRDANIRFSDSVNNTARIGYLSGSLYMYTNGAERLRINQSGDVGIGTTSPSSYGGKLVVVGSSGVRSVIANTDTGVQGTVKTFLDFYGTNTSTEVKQQATVASAPGVAASSGGCLMLFTNNSSFTSTERLRITEDGAWGLSGSTYGSSGQVLTSGGASAPPTWTTVSGGGGAATPTALGTVYGSMTTTGGSPYLTALGYNAGAANTGSSNVAIGVSALQNNTSASNLTAVGYQALQANTSTGNSTAVGTTAGKANTTGQVEAFGYQALQNNTTGAYNQAFGGNGQGYNAALASNTTGNNNQAFGSAALQANTTGSSNVAMGTAALYANISGNNNVVLGTNALAANTTSSGSAAIGVQALSASTGAENSGFGYRAGFSITSGYNNTCVGKESGQVLTTGIGGTYLGALSTASSSSVSYEIVISDGGGTRTGKGSSTAFISANNGGAYQGNNASTWSTTSDQRLKKNIADNSDGLDKINSIRVRNFEYCLPEEVDAELKPTDAIQKTGVQLGVIAQELQAILPDCVKQESTGVLSVNPDNLIWYLINAVKELSARVKQLEGN